MLGKGFLSRYLQKREHVAKKSRIRAQHDREKLNSGATETGRGDESVSGKRKTRRCNNKAGKKRKIAGNNGVYDGNGEIDRISELPESIIYHIFSFLRCSKDIVRTTVLSKNWKRMFKSYYSFDFDERWFLVRGAKGKHNRIKAREVQKRKFKRYVDKSMATRLVPLASIDKFRLYANKVDRSLTACIMRWIRSAVEKNVKELDVQVYGEGMFMFMFMLPTDVIVSPSINSLKLSGSIIYEFTAIKMCNLRELSIKDSMPLSENMLKKLEDGCPLLEDLRLVRCSGLSDLVISTLVKLKRVEVQDCVVLNRIEIAASSLECFWYHSRKNKLCKIDLKDSGNLRSLTLKDKMMTDSVLEDYIFKCPLLEKLVLHQCTRLEKLKIISEKLKSLSLINCVNLGEAEIDAPNLYSLEYIGHLMPFRSMNALHLREVKFSFTKPQSQWNFGHQSLDNFDGFKGFKLILYSKAEYDDF